MWADAVGWTIGVLPIIVVVLMAVDQICSGPDDLTIMEVFFIHILLFEAVMIQLLESIMLNFQIIASSVSKEIYHFKI